jgi:hypothetical protein
MLLAEIKQMSEEDFNRFCDENQVVRVWCGLDARDELPQILQDEIEYHEEFDGRHFTSEVEREAAIEEFVHRKYRRPV